VSQEVAVSLRLFGDELFRRRILAMRYRARDFSPVLHDIKNDWTDIIERQFATEGAASGRPWAPLARATVLRRGSAHPILVRSGDLLINVTDPDHIHVSDHELTLHPPPEVETRALAHQFGFSNVNAINSSSAQQVLSGPGMRDVPARPWAVFTDIDRRRFTGKITNWLVNGDSR
jgi:hypothetical protein